VSQPRVADAQPTLPRLQFHVPLDASRLARARERVRDYLSLFLHDRGTVEQIVLCLEEACTNSIRHSGARDDIELALWFEGAELNVLVRDTGKGFDVAAFDPEIPPDVTADGGRGLFLMHHLMDDVHVSSDGGTEVRMLKRGVLRDEAQYRALLARDSAPESQAPSGVDAWTPRMRAILEDIDEGMVALDWEYRFTYVNPAAERMARTPRQDLFQRSIWDLFGDLPGTLAEQKLRAAMELGAASTFEYYYPHFASWFELRVYPTSGGISVYLRQIDERKHVEQERELLMHDLEERERLSSRLNEIGEAIGGRLDYDEIVRTVVRVAGEALNADAASIGLRDEHGWSPTYAWGMPHDFLRLRIPPEAARFADLALERRTVLPIDDYRNDPLTDRQMQRDWGFLSIMAAPLIVRGEGIGCLFWIYTQTQHRFDEPEVDFARKAAESISRALGAARLFEELSERAHFNAALGEMGEVIAATVDPEVLLDRLTEISGRSLGADAGAIHVRDETGWTVQHSWGLPADFVGTRYAFDELPTAEQAFQQRATVAVEDYAPRQQADRRTQQRVHIRSLLLVPLIFAGERVGVLGFHWINEAHSFTSEGISFAERAAAELSAALRNVDLFVETRRAHHLSESLNVINEAVMSSLDVDQILERVVVETTEALNARSSWIVRYADGWWTPVTVHGGSRDLLGVEVPADDAPLSEALRKTLRPAALEDVRAAPEARLLTMMGDRAMLGAPLVARGQFSGALYVGFAEPRSFSTEELDFVQKCGTTVATAMENARLFETERTIATILQEHFIHALPSVPGLEFGVIAEPAAEPALVGGDFFDVFELEDGRVMMLVGDVAGKGVAAAGLTETVRSTVRALSLVDPRPGYLLEMTNRVLIHHSAEGEFVTAFLLLLDLADGAMTYASAGHPPPVWVGPSTCGFLEARPGVPLGTVDVDFPEAQLRLERPETLVLYTDGVTEARRDGVMFGYQRLLRIVCELQSETTERVAVGLRDTVRAYSDVLRDDLQIVACRLA
jgi:GAF domain-containing protein/anti-sigma regulatory factor (Ser/Thr protein kinase)